jgi:hypothetical protein
MKNNNMYKYSFGAIFNLPESCGGGSFVNSLSNPLNSAKEAYEYAIKVRKATGFDCSPTATRYNTYGGSHQSIIYPIICVTHDGSENDENLEFFNHPVMYISTADVLAMTDEEKIALLRERGAVNYRGEYHGDNLFSLPF